MMKITTLNLFGRSQNWPERRNLINDYLSNERPAVAVFQEVVYLPDESPYTQVSEINHTLQYPYEHNAVTRLQTSEDYSEHREGQGLLSNYPVIKSETLVLRQHIEDHLQRIVQLVDIDIDGTIYKIANVQFAELPRHAGIHLKEVIDILKSRNEQRIILGDFNIPNIDIPYFEDIWKDEYISSSSQQDYISYPLLNTRIDYVLIPKYYRFTNIYLSGEGLSDHKALTVEIEHSYDQ